MARGTQHLNVEQSTILNVDDAALNTQTMTFPKTVTFHLTMGFWRFFGLLLEIFTTLLFFAIPLPDSNLPKIASLITLPCCG